MVAAMESSGLSASASRVSAGPRPPVRYKPWQEPQSWRTMRTSSFWRAASGAPRPPAPTPPPPVLPPAEWGRVVLVGAGPGDAELLTLKAARMLASARVVLYDNLVSEDVLRLIPQDAERIYVGKRSSNHTLPQEGIIELMVRLAKAGKSLVRLKGGDPYIFGRGGHHLRDGAGH